MGRKTDAAKAEKSVYTTGEVARLCRVATRTVQKWFDAGRLKGYRLPETLDRRVPRRRLIEFLHEHGMEDALLNLDVVCGRRHVTFYTEPSWDTMEALISRHDVEVHYATTDDELCDRISDGHADVVIIDTDYVSSHSDAYAICEGGYRGSGPLPVILIGDTLPTRMPYRGVFFQRPLDAPMMVGLILNRMEVRA